MSDFRLGVQASASPSQYVDNELVTYNDGTTQALRQRVRIGGANGNDLAKVIADGSLQVSDARETVNGTIVANNGAVTLTPSGDNSSWSLQITGTWVGTIVTEVTMDGINWIPVNSRQSNGGRLANSTTVNGLYRGVFGGMLAFRARASAWTSGTANVYISLGTQAAVFLNSDIVVQSEEQYYASSAGLNTMWNMSSQEINLAAASNTTEVPICAITNTDPVGGRVLYVWRYSIGASNTCRIRRYRSTTLSRTSGGTLITPINRGLGGQVDALGRSTAAAMYAGSSLVMANTPTQYTKSVYLAAGGQDTSTEDGSILIPPGQCVYFTAIQAQNNTSVQVEVAYWDGSSLT